MRKNSRCALSEALRNLERGFALGALSVPPLYGASQIVLGVIFILVMIFRPHGLMGRGRWQRALAALEAMRRDGRIPATYEVVYGHAWKGEPRRTAEGHPIVKLSRPGR